MVDVNNRACWIRYSACVISFSIYLVTVAVHRAKLIVLISLCAFCAQMMWMCGWYMNNHFATLCYRPIYHHAQQNKFIYLNTNENYINETIACTKWLNWTWRILVLVKTCKKLSIARIFKSDILSQILIR